MNRETRKANLKKLQLQSTLKSNGDCINNLRRTRSAATSVSNYFTSATDSKVATSQSETGMINKGRSTTVSPSNSQQNNDEATALVEIIDNSSPTRQQPTTSKNAKRTKLTAFVLRDIKDLPKAPTDDFQTPLKKVKKAPKLQRPKPSATTKSTKSRDRRKQPNIKSAFLRNEQIFGEITAQHCAADNFSGDEVQLALAISKSEMVASGALCSDLEEEVIVDLVNNDEGRKETCDKTENLHNMLQRYGFRTAAKEDFNCLAVAFLPGIKRRAKTKWANKFTALTLRNPEIQKKKVAERIDKFISEQYTTKNLTDAERRLTEYKFLSNLLRNCKAAQIVESGNFRQLDVKQDIVLENFYVTELVEVSYVRSGHLLKDWHTIPGRDLSPQKNECNANESKFRDAYDKLEEYYSLQRNSRGDISFKNMQYVETPYDAAVALRGNVQEPDQINEIQLNNADMLTDEPPDKKLKSTGDINVSSCAIKIFSSKEDTSTQKILNSTINNPKTVQSVEVNFKEDCGNLPLNAVSFVIPESFSKKQNTRPVSPDLFADSDSDAEAVTEEIHAKNTDHGKEDNVLVSDRHAITVYELYSSSEVKTSSVNANSEQESVKTSSTNVNSEQDSKKEKSQKVIDDIQAFPCVIDLTQNSVDIAESDAELNKSINNESCQNKHLMENFFLDDLTSNFCDDIESAEPFNKGVLSSSVSDEDYQRLCDKYLVPNVKNNFKRKSVSMSQLNMHCEYSRKTRNENNVQQMPSVTGFVWKTPTKVRKSSPLKRTKSNSFNSPKKLLYGSSQNYNSAESIDLTQSDLSDNEEDCVLLSDDEINYSIWKADKSIKMQRNGSSDSCKTHDSSQPEAVTNEHNFSILDVIDDFEIGASSTDGNRNVVMETVHSRSSSSADGYSTNVGNNFSIYSDMLGTSTINTRLRERAEFGILENISEPFTQTPPALWTPVKTTTTENSAVRNLKDFTLLDSPTENAKFMKRHSSGLSTTQKFNSLLNDVQKNGDTALLDEFDDFDEFDQLIYGGGDISKPAEASIKKPNTPAGLDKLLTAELSLCRSQIEVDFRKDETGQQLLTTPEKYCRAEPMEYAIAGRRYTTRIVTTPKPDYTQQSEAEILKQLYAYGIKPLKRKQAVKMLEYIYNQTHPIILDEQEPSPQMITAVSCTDQQWEAAPTVDARQQASTSTKKLELCDCSGQLLLRFALELKCEVVDEDYVFQTNVSRKIQQPLLPLHVAWYNLVCSSTKLHEAILMYEPIDLHEIYLFFKQLGYRYDPKDIKSFFDRRCIIFRYDMAPAGKQSNRHVRKHKSSQQKKR